MKLNLTQNELESARKIIASRQRRARGWKVVRWICLAVAAIMLAMGIYSLNMVSSMSAYQPKRLNDAPRDGELTAPATIADLGDCERISLCH